MFAFYRGTTAYIYKLSMQHGIRFLMYENLSYLISDGRTNELSSLQVIGSATVSALITTAAAYPLDLAHGRMAADMSKKPALVKDSSSYTTGKGNSKTMTM